MEKLSTKTSITKAEHLQIVGLLALGQHHRQQMKDIERALIGLTGETDKNGKPLEPFDGELLSRLGVEVGKD